MDKKKIRTTLVIRINHNHFNFKRLRGFDFNVRTKRIREFS